MLVTGATGCVGRAVVDSAVARGWRVRAFARNRPADWPTAVDFAIADVVDTERILELAAGCEVIVHLAGSAHRYDATLDHLRHSFVEGARAVALAARKVDARLVLLSSVAVYGTRATEVNEGAAPRPDTPYAQAKLESEQVATAVHDATIVLRPAVVYGRYDRGNVARLIQAISRFGPLVIGKGDNRKSLLFAPHLAERIVRLIESNVRGGAWCVADRDAPSQARLVATIASIIGRRRKAIHLPDSIAQQAAHAVDLLSGSNRWTSTIDRLTASSIVRGQKLDELLGYREPVPLELALAQAVEWVLG